LATFKKCDLTRAIRAAQECGATLTRVEIDTCGRIVMIMVGENAAERIERWARTAAIPAE